MKTIKLEVIEKPLTAREAMLLAEHEHTIIKDFAAFYRVGMALAEINRLRLYRTEEGRTFDQYCKEIWDMSKSRAHELIDASTVYNCLQLQQDEILSANGGQNSDSENGLKLPLNERQIRPLTKFKDHPEQITARWIDVLRSAPNGKVTASHVNKVVKDYLGETLKKTVHKAQKEVNHNCSQEFSKAFDALSSQITKERDAKYKHTSRAWIIKSLDQLRAELAEDGDPIADQVLQGGADDWNKLSKAGFSLFRKDRQSMTIKQRSDETGGWIKHSGPFDTLKEMEDEFRTILQNDTHLRG